MFLNTLNAIVVLVEVILLFNLIIIVHELGHFLAARWRGLYVEGFGVWFGKPIWQKKINGVVYSLGSIPAGGFVKLPQLAPMEAIEGETDIDKKDLPPIKPIDKIIVAFAGPLFSFLFAFVLATAVWVVGKPVHEVEKNTVIGFVQKDSPAAKAGLEPGDKVLEVNGNPVTLFHGMKDSVVWNIVSSEGETIPFKVERDGKVLTVETGWNRKPSKWWQRQALRQVGIGPALPSRVGAVEADSPAEKAGLKAGDEITRVNGEAIFQPFAINEAVEAAPDKPVTVTVQRDGQTLDFAMTGETKVWKGEKKPRIDVGIEWDPGKTVMTHPDPVTQVKESFQTIGNMVGALFSPGSDVKAQHFSGPVGIGRLYYQIFQNEDGWRLALWFSMFFNVNLAVLNMLPLPVLDGGHITLSLLEIIRRKPINARFLEVLQTACALLLIGYMLYVTFYDVQDLPFVKDLGKDVPAEVQQ